MTVSDAQCFLGLQIIRDRKLKILKVHQSTYIRKMLERFKMTDCKSVKTPSDKASLVKFHTVN
ncbi:gag-pol polyprotein-like protein [Leptotrombidium deliense]|uniref:Gag-pol polyprotein-like protein n=1 Tax=Leptotrombidium deliense TaxID=299467 RepID=A0A443Q785_9ACAR|nr:gag-pol polyprotein-like protein [Leptotrombidium deliense]